MKTRKSEPDLDEMPADVSSLKGWSQARRLVDPASVKLPTRRITINIDSDIIAVFKAEALRGGPPYQVSINQALREHLHRKEREAGEELVQGVLRALEDPTVRRKVREVAAGRRAGSGRTRRLSR